MTIQRLDHVGVVVDDLDDAVAFFVELGMELEGNRAGRRGMGRPGDRAGGRSGGHRDAADAGRPRPSRAGAVPDAAAITPEPTPAPSNVLGLRRIMFAVDDIDDALARLQSRGGELVGDVVRYGDSYRLCHVRGPAGIVVALAEQQG